MNILMLLQKILGVSFMNFVVEGNGGAGSDDGAGAGADDGADGKGSDGGSDDGAGDDKNAGKSDSDKQDSPDDKFKRWKISQAKKEAAKQVIDGKDKNPENNKKNDEDFEAYFENKFNEKIKSLGLDKLNKIDEFETKFEKKEFFNQFKEAGQNFAEYGLSVDPVKGGEVLADIEANGFTPAQLILLANADYIVSKLKSIPKAPMSTDNGSKVKVDTSKMNMQDRLAAIKGKFGIN